MNYFNQFDVLLYPLNSYETAAVRDYFKNLKVLSYTLGRYPQWETTTILDGERPDNVSYRLYGTPAYWWTFFITNDRLRDHNNEWPLSNEEFELFIEEKYPSNYRVITIFRENINADFADNNASLAIADDILVGSLTESRARVVSVDFTLNRIIVEMLEGAFQNETLVCEGREYVIRYDSSFTYDVIPYRNAVSYYEYVNSTERFLPFTFLRGEIPGNVIQSKPFLEVEQEAHTNKFSIRTIRPADISKFALEIKEKYKE